MTTVFQFAALGLGTGAAYALLAQGLVIVHRGSGVVNFAHGGVAIFAALAAALHVDVEPSALFAFVPIAMLIAMVPISFASWGVREASLIFFLGLASVPAEAALSISVAFGLSRLLMGAIGGIAWMLTRSDHYNLKVADVAK